MYKHIFFDLDRTLWDFDTNTKDTIREIYYSYGYHISIGDFDSWYSCYQKHNIYLWGLYGKGEIKKEYLRDMRFYFTLKDHGIDDIERGAEFGRKFVEQSPLRTTIYPDTDEVLSYLSRKYQLHIITNGFEEIQLNKLNNTKLIRYFDKIFTSDAVGYNKPHPGIFHHAVSSLNAKKNECLMVGDDYRIDIMGARNVDIDQVFFNHDDISYEVKPTYEIRSLRELKNFL